MMQQKKSRGGTLVALVLAAIVALPIGFVLLLSSDADPCLDIEAAQTVRHIPNEYGVWDHEQLTNAAHIIRAGASLGLSSRDQMIGIMTAIGESTLRVLDKGDAVGPDSRGLFQQRGVGWGSYEDRMDPYTSAVNFFKRLATIDGRESLEPTLVAHRVQRNADPYHYERSWATAQRIFSILTETAGDVGDVPEFTTGSERYNLGPVKSHVAYAANLLGTMFDIDTIGGYRKGNSYDLTGHQAGLAIDIMVPVTQAGQAKGQAIANYAQANAPKLGVKYIIWYQKIWSVERADEGWRDMADRGSVSANHLDHPHISFYPADEVQGLDLSDFGVCGPGSATDGEFAEVGKGGWAMPSSGRVSSPYGMRRHPVTGVYKLHSGTDYAASCGAPIHAASDGTVVSVSPNRAYGTLLTIDHGGGVVSRYAHMRKAETYVRPGQKVMAGQTVAKVGSTGYSTGCHLHFEIKVDGEFVNPASFLANQGAENPQ